MLRKPISFIWMVFIGGFKKSVTYHLTEGELLLEKRDNKTLGRNDIPEIIATYIKIS